MFWKLLRPPQSAASLSGWIGSAFLLGIILHSMVPGFAVSQTAFSFIIIFCLGFVLLRRRSIWIRAGCFCLLALVLGVWRFELSRSIFPADLHPFDARQLISSSNSGVRLYAASDPRRILSQLRSSIREKAVRIFPPEEAGLLTGILYGDRTLTKNVQTDFKRAGLMHLVAVSGSNVTIVVVLLMQVLLAFRCSRKTAFAGVTIGIIAFVLFVDPSASVVRAAIMGWLVELAPIVGRLVRPSRLLLFSAVVFCLWKPEALFFDASFALSFLAMWGLLTWAPFFQSVLRSAVPWENMRSLMASTIGATIMTIPYSMWAFGQITVWGLITSIVALPLVPWIMSVGTLSIFFPSPLFVLPARGFLDILLWISRWPDHIAWGVWQGVSIPFWVLSVEYFILFLIWRECKQKKEVIHRARVPTQEKLASGA